MATSNSPTGPFPPATSTPTKPLAQRLQESYFSGRTPSKEELLGFQDMLSTMQSLPESEVERVFNAAKTNNYDMAGRLGADYYQNKLTQQLANQRANLGTDKYYKGSIELTI